MLEPVVWCDGLIYVWMIIYGDDRPLEADSGNVYRGLCSRVTICPPGRTSVNYGCRSIVPLLICASQIHIYRQKYPQGSQRVAIYIPEIFASYNCFKCRVVCY